MAAFGSRFVALARNNHWSNYRLHSACSLLSEKDYHSQRPSYFGSVHATLEHMLIVDLLYLGRLAGQERVPPDREELDSDLRASWRRQREIDCELLRFCENQDDGSLVSPVAFRRANGQIYTEAVASVLSHFRDESFDASFAVLTLHHWPDVSRGIDELRRVARRTVVILTFDTSVGGFWLTDYFPEILDLDDRTMPAVSAIERQLGTAKVFDVPIPHDCTDGLIGANWRRPHAYLDAGVRSAISVFSRIGTVEPGLSMLRADLESGAWRRQYGDLLNRSTLDLGYRLVVA